MLNWFTQKLSQITPTGRGVPGGGVQLNLRNWRPCKPRKHLQVWKSSAGDCFMVDVRREPVEVVHPGTDLSAIVDYFRQAAAAAGGGIISVQLVQVSGLDALKVVNKFPHGTGYLYDGCLLIPLEDSHVVISMQLEELGMTGVREAVVTAHLAERNDLQVVRPEGEHEAAAIAGWFQDPYDDSINCDALNSLSDDVRIDALFPDHPLTRLRSYLSEAEQNITIDESLGNPVALGGSRAQLPKLQTRPLLTTAQVGTLHMRFHNVEDAEKWLTMSIAEDASQGQTAHSQSQLAESLLSLGLLKDMQGKFPEAESYLLQSKSAFEAEGKPHDLRSVQPLVNLGRVNLSLERIDEAERYFHAAQNILEELDPQGSPAAIVYNGMGLISDARQNYREAILSFERALELFRGVHGPNYPECATVLKNMAVSYKRLGDEQKMVACWEQATTIDRENA